jgi:hypothetical protein
VALSKLNDPENALRAYTYSLKLDPKDPMTLLNLAILQMNTGVSQSKIDATFRQFHQNYAEQASSATDTSMLDIATKLGGPSPTPIKNKEEVLSPPSVFSPRKPVDEVISPRSTQELPAVKTKIYDEERHKQRRSKQPIAAPVQNDEQDIIF